MRFATPTHEHTISDRDSEHVRTPGNGLLASTRHHLPGHCALRRDERRSGPEALGGRGAVPGTTANAAAATWVAPLRRCVDDLTRRGAAEDSSAAELKGICDSIYRAWLKPGSVSTLSFLFGVRRAGVAGRGLARLFREPVFQQPSRSFDSMNIRYSYFYTLILTFLLCIDNKNGMVNNGWFGLAARAKAHDSRTGGENNEKEHDHK